MTSIIFAILAGISVTMQNSLNGLMAPIIGAMGVSVVGFAIQSLSVLSCLYIKERSLKIIKKIPPVYYSSGLISAVTVGILGICVSILGSSVTQCCSVAGQFLMSAVVDHFGLFGTNKTRFTTRRIPGVIMILGGIVAMNLIGGVGGSKMPTQYLLIAMGLGACAIIGRTMNFKATLHTGSSLAGGISNSVGGFVSALILILIFPHFRPVPGTFFKVPAPYYLSGVFGASCCLCNIASYKNTNIFYSTVFMLIGQVVTGIVMDILVFHSLSVGKCIGIAIVFIGVILDKKINAK